MEIKCEYCGSLIPDNETKCPNCGATNENFRRAANGVPKTIEELKAWYCKYLVASVHEVQFGRILLFH